MMRSIKCLILTFCLLGISNTLWAVNPKRPWTFLVYMAADNTLNTDADPNIAQMAKASANSNVYILVYLNIKRPGQTKQTQRLIIQDGKIHQEGATTVEDSGSEATFTKALQWAVTEFPSDHLLVDLWNHGSGPLNRSMLAHRGVCYDDTTGNYLTDLNYKRAFDLIVNQYRGGKKIDIIAFDACLMADLEVAFTLQQYANFMVASQQTIPGPGYDYSDVLAPFAKGSIDPLSFARWIVGSYDRTYKSSGESYTLSATNLNKLSPVVAATNAIAQSLNNQLASDSTGTLNAIITSSADPSACPHFDEPTYIDLYSFYANLYIQLGQSGFNAGSLSTALRKAMSAVAQSIVAHVQSSEFSKAHGMSIYFADPNVGVEPSYNALYWTSANPQWANFLNQYLNTLNAY